MKFLSAHDAAILFAVFTAGVSVLVLWLKAIKWPDIAKLGIVICVCTIGGYLSAVATNAIVPTESLIANGAIIYTAGYAIYTVFFRALGLDKALYPKSALAKNAADSASNQIIDKTSNTTAKQALDTEHPSTLVVEADIRGTNPVVIPQIGA